MRRNATNHKGWVLQKYSEENGWHNFLPSSRVFESKHEALGLLRLALDTLVGEFRVYEELE